ncbi:MAG: hypothetical protein AB7L36_01080, partial [Sphingomonadaceae bacterium]
MIENNSTARFYRLNLALVSEMQTQCMGQTGQILMAQFGISYNTWKKIRNGSPIRKSTAVRLVTRVLRDQS